ncbi:MULTISPECIES: low temperature requirement protein A [unclassified Variovorax]|uniref:low temperature requirement protein A n=1 Tax=unclassified Variovorax TaxID=663243 RepID=UPI0021098F49|nr:MULTISPECIES: low temperature requirement protein A [unclassified Variovorax]
MNGNNHKPARHPSALLRSRHSAARVSNEELFFDLVYVFAVTQLSHYLLDHLTLLGALQTLLLWFAVWMGWQYTAWVTNWFEPTALPIRLVLFAIMLVALVMASALPQAFGERALVFAGCYAAIQVGRTLWVLLALGPGDALAPNFRRILAWTSIVAVLWVTGALVDGNLRLGLWGAGVLCEYVAPMVGFRFPGLGRSSTSDWTIDGGHLAERCQLFVIVALGESVLASGVAFGQAREWAFSAVLTMLVTFLGSIAMWWMYFDTSSKDAAHVIEHSDDPGGIGAKFHYTHVVLVAGIIVSAVADELVIGHGDHHVEWKYLGALLGGPAIYLFGNALFKRVVYGFTPQSHIGGLAVLALIAPFASHLSVATVGAMTTAVMVAVALLESMWRRQSRARAAAR